MYPLVFPFFSSIFYRLFGFYGLTILPAVCGAATVYVTYLSARLLNLRFRLALVPIMGVATPLIIYSSVFWDHTAIMLAVASASYWAIRALNDNRVRSAFIAGAILGTGMWIHELVLALFVAFALATLPVLSAKKSFLKGLAAGFGTILVVWAFYNKIVYGALAGPHLGANVVANNPDHPFTLSAVLNLSEFANRSAAQLIGSTLPGATFWIGEDNWILLLYLASMLVLNGFWSRGKLTPLEQTVSAVLLLAATYCGVTVAYAIHRYYTPAGLFQATPLFIPALAVPLLAPRMRKREDADISAICWLGRATLLFIIGLLINPMYPGTDWGSRYLLSALPMLVLLAAFGIEKQLVGLNGPLTVVGNTSVVVVIAASIACQLLGLIWIHRSMAYDADLDQRLTKIHASILVTDADFHARLAPSAGNQERFLVRTGTDDIIFQHVVRHVPHSAEIDFLGLSDRGWQVEEALTLNGRKFRRSYVGVINPQKDGTTGNELQLIRYVQVPNTQGQPQ